ncbi:MULTISPECIES: hypothetical protein [unclassified Fibrobacter]|uniref:hypothetical protein n=1 Tax=unclassified Fibrobacter TaxID=2634177 RepID=UPI0025C059CE|nr:MULTISPECIES: hypothetical protein [unclassified Fibrobacter]
MRLFFLCSLVLALVTEAFAAPASKLLGAVDSKGEFSGERLFAVLDSVGGTGTWMEWDVNGVRDPSVMKVLDPLLKSNNKPKMVWVISERERPLLSVLLPKGTGEVIVFYELASLDAKPVPLKMNRVLSPDVVFRDYRAVSPSEFVHLDRPTLKVVANDKSIRFTYENRDATPLRFDSDFATKTVVEKRSEIRNYRDFFAYEYSLMLRAFVQSTRALFNWQPWHWYMASFNSSAMISDTELEAILSKGVKPAQFTIFKTKAVDGQWVEFKTDGNGFYEMVITNP